MHEYYKLTTSCPRQLLFIYLQMILFFFSKVENIHLCRYIYIVFTVQTLLWDGNWHVCCIAIVIIIRVDKKWMQKIMFYWNWRCGKYRVCCTCTKWLVIFCLKYLFIGIFTTFIYMFVYRLFYFSIIIKIIELDESKFRMQLAI